MTDVNFKRDYKNVKLCFLLLKGYVQLVMLAIPIRLYFLTFLRLSV